jgi:putative spermidine/putrescine transport system permease protein
MGTIVKKKNLILQLWRYFIIFVVGAYLLLPLYSMLDFSTKPFGGAGPRTLRAWEVIPHKEGLAQAISISMALAILVMFAVFALVVPTVIWVHLKLPKMRRLIELICLLPLAIPAIVLVVGIAPIYRWISINFTESPITLAGVYVMLVLPYTYRSLSASLSTVDIKTLAEAANTLGASTMRMIFGAVMPTIRSGIMSGAVVSIALVLGEYTISSILNYNTLQVVIALIGQDDGNVAVAVSLASLLFVFALLVAIPTTKRKKEILDVDVA